MQLERRHEMINCTVVLLGQQPQIIVQQRCKTFLHQDGLRYTRSLANQLGAQSDRIHLLKAAPGQHSVGYQQILTTDQTVGQHWMAADGILLEQCNSAAFFQTADCPTVVIGNRKTGVVGMVHCGRPAAEPVEGENIITKLLALIMFDGSDTDKLEVYITGAIAGADFQHDNNDDIRAKALPFLKEFGSEVFTDVDTLALDMVAVIKHQLTTAGLRPDQITHDGLNTYRVPGLASHRRSAFNQEQRMKANTVLVVT